MAKLADAADLKSADLYRSWGFKSPSGHHKIKNLDKKLQQTQSPKIDAGATLFQVCKDRIQEAN